ncbi:MAG: DUF4245 family protein [Microbacterium sp.]
MARAARSDGYAPQTPQDIADQKAQRSRNYLASQNFHNLLIALGASVVGAAVLIFAVPRGSAPEAPTIDVAAIAQSAEDAVGDALVVPDVPDDWRVNAAELDSGSTVSWNVVYVPQQDAGFLRFSQGIDADDAWAQLVLDGAASTEQLTIDGRVWDVYELAGTNATENVSYALGTQVGDDHVLAYGSVSPDTTAQLASLISSQLDEIEASSSEDQTQ